MASKNLYYIIKHSNRKFDLQKAIPTAIRNNAIEYLNPPITNIAYKGILKTSSEITQWFKMSKDIENEFKATALIMEKAGTGGALFRNLYPDFLKKSYNLLKLNDLKIGHEAFIEIAKLWTSVSDLFIKVSETKDIKYVEQASDTLKIISDKEKKAMEVLAAI